MMIKKIFLIVLIFSSYFAQLNSQVRYFLLAGFNYSNLNPVLLVDKDVSQDDFKYTLLYHCGIGISFPIKKVSIYSGLNISARGAKDYIYNIPIVDFVYDNYTFLELPLLISKNIGSRFEFGSGIVCNYKLASNIVLQGDENEDFGFDIKMILRYKIRDKLRIEGSYLIGNLDKYIFNKKDNFMHSVFGFNVSYYLN